MATSSPDRQRLTRLLAFLERDPGNVQLLRDAAETAYAAGDHARARTLIAELAGKGPLPAAVINVEGLIAIAERRYADAIAAFETLRAEGGDDPGLRFNLAWAHAMLARYEDASALLDEQVVSAIPRAAALKIRMLHHLDRYEDALALGEVLSDARPDDAMLMGNLATLALDAERPDLARRYAEQAPSDPQSLAALGTLALGDDDVAGAEALFEDALARDSRNPRAWLGKGLALLAANRTADAVPAIDHGAALFKDHIGSWIASGWAHYAAGDERGARESFERALAIDPNFGETHGALAVLDIAAGNIEQGRRRAEVALRLDRGTFGGQLARVLLLERAGDESGAARIRERALSTPIGANGRTIGQTLASFARRRRA
jgi:tetratricopeptide (TPR) repeat protein